IACRSLYGVRTGNIVGQTQSNVEALIGDPADAYVATGQYRWADGTVRDLSKSLILAPIGDLAAIPGFCPGQKVSGTKVEVQVVGFAMLFIESVSKVDGVIARLINVSPCGPEPPSGDDAAGADFAVPLRLVRLPE